MVPATAKMEPSWDHWHPTDIMPVSTSFDQDVYKSIKKDELKILCGTLQVLGRIELNHVKASHIFVDEAGQATEGKVYIKDFPFEIRFDTRVKLRYKKFCTTDMRHLPM